jgi:competence protein ComGC
MFNKKGFEEEGTKFNLKNLAVLILFLVVLAVLVILLIPRLTAQSAGETTAGFGKSIYDMLTGGV